ncbi:MAG: acyl carrier protein [Myxococcota bacterium]
MTQQLTERIRQFVTTNFYVADGAALKNDQSLLEAGIVDSTGVLEIITFLEAEFGITVEDEEMVPENLDAVDHIAAFVQRKKG